MVLSWRLLWFSTSLHINRKKIVSRRLSVWITAMRFSSFTTFLRLDEASREWNLKLIFRIIDFVSCASHKPRHLKFTSSSNVIQYYPAKYSERMCIKIPFFAYIDGKSIYPSHDVDRESALKCEIKYRLVSDNLFTASLAMEHIVRSQVSSFFYNYSTAKLVEADEKHRWLELFFHSALPLSAIRHQTSSKVSRAFAKRSKIINE